MEVSFGTQKLQKLCNNDKKLKGEYGAVCAKKIQRRLAELSAAVCLEDLRYLPGRYHELIADRKGQLAVDLKQPLRLVFEPDHQPFPTNSVGQLNWKQVTKVRILEIVDYH